MKKHTFEEAIKILDTIPHEEWPLYFDGSKKDTRLGQRLTGNIEIFLSDNLKGACSYVVVWSAAKFENCSSELGIQYSIEIDGWKFRDDIFLGEVEERHVVRRYLKHPNCSTFDTRSRIKTDINNIDSDEECKIVYQKLTEDGLFVDAVKNDLYVKV